MRALLQLHRLGVLKKFNFEFPDGYTSEKHVFNVPSLHHLKHSPAAKHIPVAQGGSKQHCLLVEAFDKKSKSFSAEDRRKIQHHLDETMTLNSHLRQQIEAYHAANYDYNPPDEGRA